MAAKKNTRDKEQETADSKERILKTAEELFAEKGFDGARVDAIARRAGVNKALIYYYFKSKDALLEELLGNMVAEAVSLVTELAPEDFSIDSFSSEESLDALLKPLFAFLKERANLMKIILMESMKSSAHSEILFRLVAAMLEKSNEFYRRFGLPVPNEDDFAYQMVGEFFTGMLPLAAYFALEENMSGFLNISREKLWDLFQRAFMVSHVHYSLEGIRTQK